MSNTLKKDVVLVYNKDTGKQREMGTIQFESWGKRNGFALVPESKKPQAEKPEPETAKTGTDEAQGPGPQAPDAPKQNIPTTAEGEGNSEEESAKEINEVGKTDTANESENENKETSETEKKTEGNDEISKNELATKAIARIKELGKAGDKDAIAAYVLEERSWDEKRTTVLDAADKFLNV